MLQAEDRLRLKQQITVWADRIALFRPTDPPEPWSLVEGSVPDELLEELGAYLVGLEPIAVAYALRNASAPFGLLLIACFAMHARQRAEESDTWSALENVLPKARPLLFPNGFPTPELYDALECGFSRYQLRTSGPRGEGHYFVVSLRLQIGFTERGMRTSWHNWLCIGQIPDAAQLLRQQSPSFQAFWNIIRQGARKRLAAKDVIERLLASPWVAPDFIEELACLVTETQRGQLQMRPVRFVWSSSEDPHLEIDLSALYGNGVAEGIVTVDGNRCGKLVRGQDGKVGLVGGVSSICVPVFGPECIVQHSGLDSSEKIVIWDASSDVSKVEGPSAQRLYASRSSIEPEAGSFLRFHSLHDWNLWELNRGLFKFIDNEGDAVYEIEAPPPRMEVNLRIAPEFKCLGEKCRVKVLTTAGTPVRIRIGDQTAPVDNGLAWLDTTSELAARPYVPRVRVRTESGFRELAGQRTRILAYGVASRRPEGEKPVQIGSHVEYDVIPDLWVVCPEPDWAICEGPFRIAKPKEGGMPFPTSRLNRTGESLSLRRSLLDNELVSWTFGSPWPEISCQRDRPMRIDSNRYLEIGDAEATLLFDDGTIFRTSEVVSKDGWLQIGVDCCPLAIVVRGLDGDILEFAWRSNEFARWIGTSLTIKNSQSVFSFLRSACMPIQTEPLREPLRKAIKQLPAEWLSCCLSCPQGHGTVDLGWSLAAGRLLHAAKVDLDLQSYQRLKRETRSDDAAFCFELANVAPLAAKGMVRLLPKSSRMRIAGSIRERFDIPSDDDDLDELIAEDLSCTPGTVTMIRRTIAGQPCFGRASSLPEAIANSPRLRLRVVIHWLEDQ